jgi:hypothetical protein
LAYQQSGAAAASNVRGRGKATEKPVMAVMEAASLTPEAIVRIKMIGHAVLLLVCHPSIGYRFVVQRPIDSRFIMLYIYRVIVSQKANPHPLVHLDLH